MNQLNTNLKENQYFFFQIFAFNRNTTYICQKSNKEENMKITALHHIHHAILTRKTVG